MRLSALLVPVTLVVLSGCVPPPPEPVVLPTPEPIIVCDATPWQHLVGDPIERAEEIDFAGTVRVLGPDEFLTKDYDIRRMTVTTRRNRADQLTVGRVFCG